MTNKSTIPQLLGTSQLCEIFGISRRTLDNWIAFKIIPVGFLIGGKRYWRESDVAIFIRNSAGGGH